MEKKPIPWIRAAYPDESESSLQEIEQNYRDFVMFLYFSNIGREEEDSPTLTESKDQDSVNS